MTLISFSIETETKKEIYCRFWKVSTWTPSRTRYINYISCVLCKSNKNTNQYNYLGYF